MKDRKGFIMTLVTFFLFLLLIGMALRFKTEKEYVGSEMAEMTVTRKVLYTFDDIVEDFDSLLGVEITTVDNNLTIYDHLPNENMGLYFSGYSEFLDEYYITPELEVKYFDENGSEVSFVQIPSFIVIYPYKVIYEYEDWGKRVLEVDCDGGACTNDDVGEINLVFNLTNSTFNWDPTQENKNRYKWAPDKFYLCENGNEYCINFTLTIRDSMDRVYSCPGPICNYTAFPSNEKSALDIQMTPCWFEIKLGDENLFEVRLHQPNNPDAPCDANVDSATSLLFNASNYYIKFPVSVKVRDVNYNTSKFSQVVIKGAGIGSTLPLYEESQCLSLDSTGVYVSGGRRNYVRGLKISNSCEDDVTIDKMKVSWSTPQNTINRVKIGGRVVWSSSGVGSPSGEQPSGTTLDIEDYRVRAQDTDPIDYLRFSGDMRWKNFTIVFIMSDGSQTSASFNT